MNYEPKKNVETKVQKYNMKNSISSCKHGNRCSRVLVCYNIFHLFSSLPVSSTSTAKRCQNFWQHSLICSQVSKMKLHTTNYWNFVRDGVSKIPYIDSSYWLMMCNKRILNIITDTSITAKYHRPIRFTYWWPTRAYIDKFWFNRAYFNSYTSVIMLWYWKDVSSKVKVILCWYELAKLRLNIFNIAKYHRGER